LSYLLFVAGAVVGSALGYFAVKRITLRRYTDRIKREFLANELPVAYLTPEGKTACENCAKQVAGGDISAYNAARGFDWRGAWITLEESQNVSSEPWWKIQQGPLKFDPFYVLFADGITVPQIEEFQRLSWDPLITDLKVDGWDDYKGESTLAPCEYCFGFAQTITAEYQMEVKSV